MIRDCTANQIRDISRLGVKNEFGEKLHLKEEVSINPDWEEIVIYPGYFNSIGLQRLYFKDREINTKDKYYTPYRSYMLEVCGHKNVIVNQCVDHDRIYLKIVGFEKTIEDIKMSLRPDYRLDSGMTDEEIIEANRRDLEKHKRIVTMEVKFNGTPEKLDKHGQVITNLDHYDNFFYEMETCEAIVYRIYNAQRSREWLLNKLSYLEDRYERFVEECDRDRAIHALGSLTGIEDEYIRGKSGKHIFKKMDMICFETDLNSAQVWAIWKYTQIQDMEETIFEIKEELKKIKDLEEGG